MASASCRVFAIPELVEIILTHLGDANAASLTRLQRVNTTWHSLIRRMFQEELFFKAKHDRRYAYWTRVAHYTGHITRIMEAVRPPWPERTLCMELKKAHPILRGKMIESHANLHEYMASPDFAKTPIQQDPGPTTRGGEPEYRFSLYIWGTTVYQLDDMLLTKLPLGSAWETAFATQPPVSEMQLQLHAEGNAPEVDCFNNRHHGIIRDEGRSGITLGQLRERIDFQLEKSRKTMGEKAEGGQLVLSRICFVLEEILVIG